AASAGRCSQLRPDNARQAVVEGAAGSRRQHGLRLPRTTRRVARGRREPAAVARAPRIHGGRGPRARARDAWRAGLRRGRARGDTPPGRRARSRRAHRDAPLPDRGLLASPTGRRARLPLLPTAEPRTAVAAAVARHAAADVCLPQPIAGAISRAIVSSIAAL